MNQPIKTSQYVIALIAVLIIIGAVIFSSNSDTSGSVSFKLVSKSSSTSIGDTFTVDIALNTGGQETYGADINRLRFDPRVLQVVDADTAKAGVQISPGNLMDTTVFNTADNTLGTVQFSQVVSSGSNGKSTFSGAGVLATVTFRVIAEGKTDVTLDFTPGVSTDSNVAGAGVDILSSVVGASYVGTAAF